MSSSTDLSRSTLSPLCVYCGAADGKRPVYAQAARALGRAMAERGIDLVYGGGRAGMMGHVADAVLAHGGIVTGVITQQLMDRELGHTGVHTLHIVDTMHQRKKMMADVARGFVALPGGVGTLDELFEILAWAQLGLHTCPVGLLNVEGYYDPLVSLIDHMDDEGFLRPQTKLVLRVEREPDALLSAMESVRVSPSPHIAQ